MCKERFQNHVPGRMFSNVENLAFCSEICGVLIFYFLLAHSPARLNIHAGSQTVSYTGSHAGSRAGPHTPKNIMLTLYPVTTFYVATHFCL